MSSDSWGDGPVWIRPENDEPPECGSHGDSLTSFRNVHFVIPESGGDVEYRPREGLRLYYCPYHFTDDDSDHLKPAAAVEGVDTRRGMVRYVEERWADVKPCFEAVGEPTTELQGRLLRRENLVG